MTLNIRFNSWANYRFIVEVTNICDKNVKDRVPVGWSCDYLAEGGGDVKKMLDI